MSSVSLAAGESVFGVDRPVRVRVPDTLTFRGKGVVVRRVLINKCSRVPDVHGTGRGAINQDRGPLNRYDDISLPFTTLLIISSPRWRSLR